MAKPYRHVALIVETSKEYGRELLLGIGRYIQAHGPWSVFFAERGESDEEPEWLRDWEGDGIITRSRSAIMSKVAQARGVPVVNLAYHRDLDTDLDMPCVNCDHPATARIVAEHFQGNGFTQFGYCHADGQSWSEDRRDAFVAACGSNGHGVAVHDVPADSLGDDGDDWEQLVERLAGWVASLPKPCGIMAAYDVLGARLIDACRRIDVRVPEEVAVVGVDNDSLFCNISWPQLSSVDQNVEKIGFEAARLLASMFEGGAVGEGAGTILIPPKGLVTRASSDIFALDDRSIAAALQFIRDNADRRITVDEVSRQTSLSRRELERRFQQQLGTSPYKRIQQARIQRVGKLLVHTDDTLEAISEALEFSEAANMANLFKKLTGMSPGEYRKAHASGGSD